MTRSCNAVLAAMLAATLGACNSNQSKSGAVEGGSATSAPHEDDACCAHHGEVKAIALFNGKDLSGWEPVGNAAWSVDDGCIVGRQGEKNAPGDLLTQASYADFDLTCEYKVVWPANTGVWFRYQSANKAYQADILEWPDPQCYSGTLYSPGKMFIAMNTDKSIEDRAGWNVLRIRAEGDHLQIWLNGKQTADVHDPASETGRIGFQVHAGEQFKDMEVRVRNIMLQPLTATSKPATRTE